MFLNRRIMVSALAAAIVELMGGTLIHGAITAREYGLPCVTGVANVTELIRTCDLVTMQSVKLLPRGSICHERNSMIRFGSRDLTVLILLVLLSLPLSGSTRGAYLS
jgi:phosphoenolpyruvate synthase/pyruvate phosphate dikinase